MPGLPPNPALVLFSGPTPTLALISISGCWSLAHSGTWKILSTQMLSHTAVMAVQVTTPIPNLALNCENHNAAGVFP